jgi:hypothetical protein
MMKRLLRLFLAMALVVPVALALPVVSQAAPDITPYDQDRPGWEGAVVDYEEEFFTDATLNPGVSVDSEYPGYIDTVNGVWWDRLVCPGEPGGPTTTTWQFDPPIFAFGGNWDPGVPGGPGAAIAVSINGSWVPVGEIPNNYTGQFWGFVSTELFSQVRLKAGSVCDGAWAETYEMDNMVYSFAVVVPVDIKPMSCPNPLNVGAKGVLPVAILGTADFDVTQVDVATVQLEGVSPLRWDCEDVATPFEPFIGKEACDCCTEEGPDGYLDLTLKFDTQEIVAALGDVEDGDCVVLHLTGNLMEEYDGTPILGEDVVVILKKK